MKGIAIIPNTNKQQWCETTKRLIECLNNKARLYMDSSLEEYGFDVFFCDDVFQDADCAVVLGGDGTILQAAEKCARRGIPILGINLGRIGFMTEVETVDMEKATEALLAGDFIIEDRMMLKVIVVKENVRNSYHALNDVVVSKTDDAKLIQMNVFSGDEMIHKYIADGLIISTPTGSTGYNLSAGGPVVNPLMKLFLATPICAHMLTARPVVMPADEDLRIVFGGSDTNTAVVTVDGRLAETIENGDSVIITHSKYTTKIIKIGNQSFYNVFIRKLS